MSRRIFSPQRAIHHSVRNVRTTVPRAQAPNQSQPGDRILPLLRTPFDIFALGPRLSLGALSSIPDLLQQIPTDVEKISVLLQDPRPIEYKQAEVMEVLEDRIARYVEKGTAVEGDVLETVSAMLPQELKNALPDDVKNALLRSKRLDDTYTNTSVSNGKPIATWTFSSVEVQSSDDEFAITIPATGTDVAADQVLAELEAGQTAATALRERLAELAANADPSRDGMLRLNVREAEGSLARWLEQLSPSSRNMRDPPVADAVKEAESLLAEVQTLI